MTKCTCLCQTFLDFAWNNIKRKKCETALNVKFTQNRPSTVQGGSTGRFTITHTHRDTQTDTQTHRHTDTDTDTDTHTHTHTHTQHTTHNTHTHTHTHTHTQEKRKKERKRHGRTHRSRSVSKNQSPFCFVYIRFFASFNHRAGSYWQLYGLTPSCACFGNCQNPSSGHAYF